jgi:predicted nucleic acid-binding protein
MNARPFFDTNILLYLLGSDPDKATVTESLLACRGVCSVQVLNEIASVMRRKIGASWPDIVDFTGGVRRFLLVEPITLQTHERALHLAPRY